MTLIPSGISSHSGWRFVGEQQWRSSGASVTRLTDGERQIEYRPVTGYIQPLRETVHVHSPGSTPPLTREYFNRTNGGSGGVVITGAGVGGLTVFLKPDAIAAPSGTSATRAKWRLFGEDDSNWRNSGATIGTTTLHGIFTRGLLPGVYLIECKPVPGRTTPVISVSVQAGQARLATATYSLPDATTGTPPTPVLPPSTVATSPYCFVGQIRSDLGLATGFVVKPQVVRDSRPCSL